MARLAEKVTVAVLEADNNKKGDLFGRAMQDLFHALGYEDFILNVAKAGREIDIKGKHRTEKRVLLAECKATKGAIGGSDVNKFAGAVEVERIRAKERPVAAYYVSLGGYTASAVEQEEEAGNRLVLLDGRQIVEELVRGRVVVSQARAAAVAAAVQGIPASGLLGDKCALLIHDIGWLWAFFFKTSGKYTHFTLVHADGYGIHADLAAVVVASDADSAKLFDGLTLISSASSEKEAADLKEQAKAEYFAYLEREFGGITLEGLPADQEVGSRTIRLESIYVPLHLNPLTKPESSLETEEIEKASRTVGAPRLAVKDVLVRHRHIAVLAAPGGGKTTLLKRLAVAYAVADRRGEVADELPPEEWFPLFIRCRQLGEHVRKPVTELIKVLPRYAERSDLIEPFSMAASEALKLGKVLLLVDGLDEISDPGDRASFAAQLRTFIGTYPAAHVVVTSREAGFRAVSGAMSSACSLFKISDLSTADIYSLCRSWQHEVVGGTTEAANKIAQSIVNKPRVRDLAINPLLLTTLLLVQRWFGELPPKRSVLYEKAIEVLLMTWNTEGHTPIDQEEAMPQLAYAAFSMLNSRRQSVSAKGLKDLFDEARAAMPEVLGYARMSSTELIERVEDRSSLLVQSGHIIEDGQIRPLYEFKHLTFQEYLAAKACVEGWSPERGKTDDYSEVLAPYLKDESWSEVVPLAAVLAGSRGAKKIVDRLIDDLEDQYKAHGRAGRLRLGPRRVLCDNLVQCLIDEAQISPDQVRKAIDVAIRSGDPDRELIRGISQSKFADEVPKVAWAGYQLASDHMSDYGGVLASLAVWQLRDVPQFSTSLVKLLRSDEDFQRVAGAGAAMVAFFSMEQYAVYGISEKRADLSSSFISKNQIPSAGEALEIKAHLLRNLSEADRSLSDAFMVMWAFAWMGEAVQWSDEELIQTVEKLLEIWRTVEGGEVARMAAWALWRLPLISEDSAFAISRADGLRSFLLSAGRSYSRYDAFSRDFSRAAVLIGSYAGLKIPNREKLPNIEKDRNPQHRKWADKLASLEARGDRTAADAV